MIVKVVISPSWFARCKDADYIRVIMGQCEKQSDGTLLIDLEIAAAIRKAFGK